MLHRMAGASSCIGRKHGGGMLSIILRALLRWAGALWIPLLDQLWSVQNANGLCHRNWFTCQDVPDVCSRCVSHLDSGLRLRICRFLRLRTCRKLSLEAEEQQHTMDCTRSSEKRVFNARFSRDCFCVGRQSVPSMVSKRVHHAAATRALSVKASMQCLSYITRDP